MKQIRKYPLRVKEVFKFIESNGKQASITPCLVYNNKACCVNTADPILKLSGVYLICDAHDVQYCGESNKLGGRFFPGNCVSWSYPFFQTEYLARFQDVFVVAITIDDHKNMEKMIIKKFGPSQNSAHNEKNRKEKILDRVEESEDGLTFWDAKCGMLDGERFIAELVKEGKLEIEHVEKMRNGRPGRIVRFVR